ncbi:hypothetical protein VIGAN_06244300, partial [Vigna angularis var. angularis]
HSYCLQLSLWPQPFSLYRIQTMTFPVSIQAKALRTNILCSVLLSFMFQKLKATIFIGRNSSGILCTQQFGLVLCNDTIKLAFDVRHFVESLCKKIQIPRVQANPCSVSGSVFGERKTNIFSSTKLFVDSISEN